MVRFKTANNEKLNVQLVHL